MIYEMKLRSMHPSIEKSSVSKKVRNRQYVIHSKGVLLFFSQETLGIIYIAPLLYLHIKVLLTKSKSSNAEMREYKRSPQPNSQL